MKRLCFMVYASIMVILGFAALTWAGEASIFDDTQDINVRAFTKCTGGSDGGVNCPDTSGTPSYSVYLEVRDSEGNPWVDYTKLIVTDVTNLSTPTLLTPVQNPFIKPADPTQKIFVIHNNTASSPDISLSFDKASVTTHLFCTDGIGVMPMSYTIDVIAPKLSVTPTSISFGNVNVGSSSSQTVTVSNPGQGTLTIAPITAPSPFSVSGCTSGVASGGNCSLTVTFAPTSVISYGNTFTINSNGGSQIVSLTGAGVQPQLSVAPTTVAFGSVNAGSSLSKTLNVTNSGTGTLTITSISGPSAPFSVSGCTSGVSAGTSCTLTVTFAPTAVASYPGTFTINSNGGSQTVSLSGAGVTPTWPNLVITQALGPGVAGTFQPFDVVVTVMNKGTGAAGAFNVTAYLGSSYFSPLVGATALGSVRINGLAAGQSTTVTISVSGITLSLHTTYVLTAVVDSGNEVAESNETDNMLKQFLYCL